MTYQALLDSIGDYAKDIRLNLKNVLDATKHQSLSENQIAFISLSCAYATRNQTVIQAIEDFIGSKLTEQSKNAAKSSATIMAMNNIYYRFVHLVSDKAYQQMPAGLRMNALMNHQVDKIDFELSALAVSAINGCGLCIDSHVKTLEKSNVSQVSIQHAIKIASVLNALAQSIAIR
ncbi:carboxymuconolactone decarboxylase family protein [Thiotrichales bacterium 19S9-12]|nr:carboxymuconolactone decarboxylase family protein [Thiotrichales bacterium 19S9-11]MCF6811066.1 carboxymuconolactone decarboxylase family protein [Thiotrichales bacterium 19S9-12]